MNVFLRVGIALLLLLVAMASPIAAQGDATPADDAIIIDPDDVAEGVEQAAQGAAEAGEAAFNSLRDFLQRAIQTPNNQIIQLAFIIGGVILLLLGWRIYDEIIVFAGVMVGAALASSFVVTDSFVIEVAAILIGALIGGLIGFFLFYLGVFLIGVYVGLALTVALATLLNLTPLSGVVLLLGGLIGGILMLALSLQLVIVISAVTGAQLIVQGLGLSSEWILILGIIGIAAQYLAARATGTDIRRRRVRD